MWDQYLHESGTSIPAVWVSPVEPSHEIWSRFLDKTRQGPLEQ